MPYFPLIKSGQTPITVKSFATATDEEITDMLTAVRAGDLSYDNLVSAGWTVGAERSVSLSAMEATNVGESHVAQTQTLVILHGNNFFDLQDGGKNLFVVGLKNCLNEIGYINSSNTNSGGWNSSKRRSWCNSIFKNALPSEVQKWFKQFEVKASNGNGSTSVTTSTDWFSLPSRAEVFGGSDSYTPDAEGTTPFDYYTTSGNRVKMLGDSGSAGHWWLRSPSLIRSDFGYYGFCTVSRVGELDYTLANGTTGIAPFGCF